MGGSQIQLVSYGRQDVHLTGNPQITFFKNVYRRHTNFAMEPKQLIFDRPIRLSNLDGNSVYSLKVTKEADLVGSINLEVTVNGSNNNNTNTCNHFGNSLLKEVRLKIGGVVIDRHYSQWLQIYRELYDSTNTDHENNSDSSIGGRPNTVSEININNKVCGDTVLDFSSNNLSKTFYIPLRFWFNNTVGNFLPIIALDSHEVLLEFVFENINNIKGDVNINNIEIKPYADYYYLDIEEKRKFSQSSHEYLIEQVRRVKTVLPSTTKSSSELDNLNVELDFYNPIKFISWVVVNPEDSNSNVGMGPCYFTSLCSSSNNKNDGNDGSVSIKLNGEDRITTRPMSYFTRYLPKIYRNSANIPNLDRIGMYSFALNPLDINPSGTCNFSKILNKEMIISVANIAINSITGKDLHLFAVNYNIFRINGGLGGLAYTN